MRIQDFKTGDRVRILTGPCKGREGWVVLPPEVMSPQLLKGCPWPGLWRWLPVFYCDGSSFSTIINLLHYLKRHYPFIATDGLMADAAGNPEKYIFSPYYLNDIALVGRRRRTRRRGRPHKMKGPQVCLDFTDM